MAIAKTAGIYAIRNNVTGMVYIGSAMNLRHRSYTHFNQLRRGTHYNAHLLNAFAKYGESSFDFVVLEHLLDASAAQLIVAEQQWLDATPATQKYNIRSKAESNHGVSPSVHTRRLISESKKGKPRPESLRVAISGANNYAYGKSEYNAHRSRILDLLKQGESLRGIASTVGGSVSGLRAFLGTVISREPETDLGVVASNVIGNNSRKRTVVRERRIARGSKCDSFRSDIMRLLSQGHTRAYVSRCLGINSNTLLHFLRGQARFGCLTSRIATKEAKSWQY